jgi:hypothetical protein
VTEAAMLLLVAALLSVCLCIAAFAVQAQDEAEG